VFFNQYINPIALENFGWKYYIFHCVWLGVELTVVWFFYIETRNTPLEEIAKYFDGENCDRGWRCRHGEGAGVEEYTTYRGGLLIR
jgi:hypothetical protein